MSLLRSTHHTSLMEGMCKMICGVEEIMIVTVVAGKRLEKGIIEHRDQQVMMEVINPDTLKKADDLTLHE